MKRILLAIAATVLAVVPVVVYGQVTKPASPAPAAIGGSAGRFVAITPPQAAPDAGAYNNFLWVLDSQAGKVKAYRLVNIKDDNDKSVGWGYEELANAGVGQIPK